MVNLWEGHSFYLLKGSGQPRELSTPTQHSCVTHEPAEPPLGSQVLKTTPTISILPASHHAIGPIPHLVPLLFPYHPPLITSTCIDMLSESMLSQTQWCLHEVGQRVFASACPLLLERQFFRKKW